MTIEVFPVGTEVWVGPDTGRVAGLITGVMLEDYENVSYRVVWWNGNDRRSEWLIADEVTTVPDQKRQTIGFLGGH